MMWFLVLLVGSISIVNATPVYEKEITKQDLDVASEKLSTALKHANDVWISESAESYSRLNTIYASDIRSSYYKLQEEIETAIRNSTDYSISKIIPFLNQSENNRELLQCIDLKKTFDKTDEVVQHVLSNVHSCKWSVIYEVLDDLYWVSELISYPNSNLTTLTEESSKCIQNTSSTSNDNILRCMNKVTEKVQQAEKEIYLYLENYEYAHKEKLSTRLRFFNECNEHIHFSEVRKVQDEQLDAIQNCLNTHQNVSSDNTTGVQNKLSSEDIIHIINATRFHFEEKIVKALEFVESRDIEVGKRMEIATDKLNSADALDTIEIIENSWKNKGYENETLSKFLSSEEYSTLLECTKAFTECSSEVLLRSYAISMSMANIIDPNFNQGVYDNFSKVKEQGAECLGGMNNISSFYNVVSCILRVDGQASHILTDEVSRLLTGVETTLQMLSNQLDYHDKCHPQFSSSSHIDFVRSCFSTMYEQKSNIIFGT